MKKFLVLGIASGLNRAGVFLLSPIIALFISIEEYGQLSLFLTVSSLLVAFFTLNLSSVIAREVYSDLVGVLRYLKLYNSIAISLLIFIILFSSLYDCLFVCFLFYIVFDGLFLVNSTYLRYRVGDLVFFIITLVKFLFITLSLTTYLAFFVEGDFNPSIVFILLGLSNFPAIFCGLRFAKLNVKNNRLHLNKKYMVFSILLLPHVVAQWISSGVDRYFVDWFFDPITLGYYSFSYSLASVFMLVNASLSLSLPQIAVKNITNYMSVTFFSKLSVVITLIYCLFVLTLYLLIPNIESYYGFPVLLLSLIILSGLYVLCFYTYYSSILFYERKAKLLSSLSIFLAILTLLLLYPISYFWGVVGTALVTFFSYSIYAVSVAYCVSRSNVYKILPFLFFSTFIIFMSTKMM